MKAKVILWSVVLGFILGFAAGGYWWKSRPQVITWRPSPANTPELVKSSQFSQPQVITLDDGTKLTLIGVTYGTYHVCPVDTVAHKLTLDNKDFGWPQQASDTLVVWIETQHKANQHTPYGLAFYDKEGTAFFLGGGPSVESQINDTTDIRGLTFHAYPRWDSTMILRVSSSQPGDNGEFVITNPAPKSFPSWPLESLPDTQSDGDLDVTLTKLIFGAPSPEEPYSSLLRDESLKKVVQFAFDIRQKGQSVTNWRPLYVETTDGTGNWIGTLLRPYHKNGQSEGYYYHAALWPSEPAWKIRVEFSCTSGFSNDDVWVVTNVPVRLGSQQDDQAMFFSLVNNSGETTAAFADTTINGVRLKLFPAVLYTNQDQPSPNHFVFQNQDDGKIVSFSLKAVPNLESEGMKVTLVKVTDDQNRELQNPRSSHPTSRIGGPGRGGSYQYQFSSPRDASALNITLALHRDRFVDFTVKPGKQ